MHRVVAIVALCFALLAGCATVAGPAEPDPDRARQRWIDALSSGDPARVWELLGDEARAGFTGQAAFDAWCRRYCADLLVATLAGSDEPTVAALVGGHTELVREDDAWRIRRSDLVPLADDARAAGLRLARQLEQLAASGTLSAERARASRDFAAALRALGPSAWEGQGGRLEIAVPGGGKVVLVEQSGWRVDAWQLP